MVTADPIPLMSMRIVIALALLATAACDGPTPPIPSDPDLIPKPRNVAQEDYVNLAGGLKYHDFIVGTGDPVANGDLIAVHYHGWLYSDSTLFDSSYLREEPFIFEVGRGAVISGWDLGVVGMAVDGERQLVIPPELAYGDRARNTIPANSTLIFELRLMNIY